MIYYDYYADIPAETVNAFVREREMGRLVTVSVGGLPHIGLHPFAYDGTAVEVHLNRADEQIADLKAHPQCVFEVDDVLGVIPSYWVHPEDAVMATAYHRTVIFDCEATVSEDAAVRPSSRCDFSPAISRKAGSGRSRRMTPCTAERLLTS